MRVNVLLIIFSLFGCMSWISRIVPFPSIKATESGISVFFIQNEAGATDGITKSMPESGARDSRNMRPEERSASSSATSALMLVWPMVSVATGSSDCAVSTEKRAGEVRRKATKRSRIVMTEEFLPNLLTVANSISHVYSFLLPCTSL